MSVLAGAICLFLDSAQTKIPADHFTLTWIHSVQKTEWQEDYRLRGGKLVLTQARIKGSGAGMDPPPGAILSNGWWRYRPAVAPLSELRLTLSEYTSDYQMCWSGRCQALAGIVRAPKKEGVVSVRACTN